MIHKTKKKTTLFQKSLAVLLSLTLLVGTLPITALAEALPAESIVTEDSALTEPDLNPTAEPEATPAPEPTPTTEPEATPNPEPLPEASPTPEPDTAPTVLAVNSPPPQEAVAVTTTRTSENQVHVLVENNTFPLADGAPWEGKLIDSWVELNDDSTMMTAAMQAIAAAGETQVGGESNYISEISGLAQFSGGSMSGWMGTLNDWFTDQGFGAYTVADGTLEAGDEISLVYTCSFGSDVGNIWGDSTTTLTSLSVSQGELSPNFSPEVTDYRLTLPTATKSVVVTPSAYNKTFTVVTTVGSTQYKRTASIPVEDGTVIHVTCGDDTTYTLTAGIKQPAADPSEIYRATGDFIYNGTPNPSFGGMGGDWAMLGLSRGGYPVSESYYSQYISNVNDYVKTNKTKLDDGNFTEYSRVVLGLTAVGADVTDIGGYNLLEPLANYDKVSWQGVNGIIWALLAFDSHNYSIPASPSGTTQSTRDNLISGILEKEVSGGGWTMWGAADPDITAMAIQALAPYCATDTAVQSAVNRALEWLSTAQFKDGSFGGYGSNSISTAQVLTALTTMKIDPAGDSRFIKNGNTVIDALCTYFVPGGGFKYLPKNTAINGMATEQGYYSLVSYYRYLAGDTSLFDMSDVNLTVEENKVNAVVALIEALPETSKITLAHEEQVAAAKKAYDDLGHLTTLVSVELTKRLQDGVSRISALKMPDVLTKIHKTTGEYICNTVTNPTVGSTGGEWAIIGLARSGHQIPENYYPTYISNVINTLQENNGILDKRKYTEYSRVVLGLTALGYDVTDVGGYNLLSPLADYAQTIWQGVNGPIWALIAFDSHGYEIPLAPSGKIQSTRENLIARILEKEISGGGWSLSGKADADITAMAIQALVPYCATNSEVRAAVDRALVWLSSAQNSEGGFGSWGTVNAESCAQVLTALVTMGIDPMKDTRFIKNEKTVLDALSEFYVAGGGFKHTMNGDVGGMATEQSFYALTAYYRFVNGQTRLYDMSDVKIDAPYQAVIALIQSIGIVTLDSGDTLRAARNAYNALADKNKAKVKNYPTLLNAEKEFSTRIKPVQEIEALISELGKITVESKAALEKVRSAYDKLTSEQQSHVSNYRVLTRGEEAYKMLWNAKEKAEQERKHAEAVVALIAKIGVVTTESTQAVRSAREAYDALTTTEKALVTNYAILIAAEEKLKNTLPAKPTPSPATRPSGNTHVMAEGQTSITLNGVKYTMDRESAALAEEISFLSQKETTDENGVITAYQHYLLLSEKQKAEVVNFPDLEAQMNRIGAKNQTAHGIELVGAEWNIKLNVKPLKQGDSDYGEIKTGVGSNTLLLAWEISLTNILDGTNYKPGTPLTLRMPKPNLTNYDGVKIAHKKATGEIEYLDCKIEGDQLSWQVFTFSIYAAIDSAKEATAVLSTKEAATEKSDTGSVPTVNGEKSPSLLWLWIILAGLSALTLVILLLVRAQTKKTR